MSSNRFVRRTVGGTAYVWVVGMCMLAFGACVEEDRPEAGYAAEGAMEPASVNTLTEQEEAEGWTLLFNGQDFAGWRALGRDSIPSAHWQVVDGAIRKVPSGEVPVQADGQPIGGADLMTEEVYKDFEFAFDFKLAPGANSGVKYNVSEELSTTHPPAHAALGFEYQILDDSLHPDAKQGVSGNRTLAALYDMIAPNENKQARPTGEWNQGRIVKQGNHVEHWLNGQKVVDYEIGSPRFDSLLAASKYKDIEGFAENRAGHVILQDHNDEVFYRNVKVRNLSPAQ